MRQNNAHGHGKTGTKRREKTAGLLLTRLAHEHDVVDCPDCGSSGRRGAPVVVPESLGELCRRKPRLPKRSAGAHTAGGPVRPGRNDCSAVNQHLLHRLRMGALHLIHDIEHKREPHLNDRPLFESYRPATAYDSNGPSSGKGSRAISQDTAGVQWLTVQPPVSPGNLVYHLLVLPLSRLLRQVKLMRLSCRTNLSLPRTVRLYSVASRAGEHREYDGDGVHAHAARVCRHNVRLQPPLLQAFNMAVLARHASSCSIVRC